MMLTPVTIHKHRVYRREGRAIGYVSWAFVDEQREERLKAGQIRLAPAEWRCGDRVWLYDVVAPFGGTDEMIGDIRQNVFPDRPMRTVQLSADGKERVTVEWSAVGHPQPNKER
jgi:cytolysin-activating lysine-acyltransferase